MHNNVAAVSLSLSELLETAARFLSPDYLLNVLDLRLFDIFAFIAHISSSYLFLSGQSLSMNRIHGGDSNSKYL